MTEPSSRSCIDCSRIFLIASGVFAVGCIGFFISVSWLGSKAPSPPQQLSVEQKAQVLNTLNASSPATTSSPSQADQSNPNAAAKLKILESLNTSH